MVVGFCGGGSVCFGEKTTKIVYGSSRQPGFFPSHSYANRRIRLLNSSNIPILLSLFGNQYYFTTSTDYFSPVKPSVFPVKQPSLYEVLQVSPTAPKEEIRKAFLELAKIYHPDISSELDPEIFRRIQFAYTVLTDEAKRREYDWRSQGIWRHSSSGLKHGSDYYRSRFDKNKKPTTPINRQADMRQDTVQFKAVNQQKKTSQQYTEAELAEQEAVSVAKRIEYQQALNRHWRDIGKRQEIERKQRYQTAWEQYQSGTKILPVDSDKSNFFSSFSHWWKRYKDHRKESKKKYPDKIVPEK